MITRHNLLSTPQLVACQQLSTVTAKCRGKWGKVMTRDKLIFQFASFNRQMTPNDKEEKLVLLPVRSF